MNSEGKPKVTILTPVYNEEASLPLYEKAVKETLFSLEDYDFEVLFIDDGSSDRSWDIISDMCVRNPQFRGIRLSRNFGSHIAISAGFFHSERDAVVILPCDLQDPPEVVPEFLAKWKQGALIVWGHRRSREDSVWKMLASKMFFKLISRFAMPKGSKFTTGSFLLVDRRVANCIRQMKEHNRITFALVAWTGFDQEVVYYDRKERVAGTSGWGFSGMLKAMYDTFVGFSYMPIRLITLTGVTIFLMAIPYSAYLVYNWATGDPLPGWTGQVLAMTVFFGVQFLLLGIIGEYLYRIFTEITGRPLYFISEETGEREKNTRPDVQ